MISSPSNPQIKRVTDLISHSKARKEEGVFVAEGLKMVMEAPPGSILQIYVSESLYEKILNGGELLETGTRLMQFPCEVVSDRLYKRMSDTQTPQGIMCIAESPKADIDDLIAQHEGKDFRVLVLEGIQDPGNLGTMIRTAEGAGFDLVVADDRTVDLYNPKVIRSTMGSIYRVPVVYCDDILRPVSRLKAEGLMICAAHLKGTCSFKEESYSNRVAVLIGNEGKGLTDRACSMADVLIKIPMQGRVESLNAAVAAALIMYEVSDR